jgi:hypothetical protein
MRYFKWIFFSFLTFSIQTQASSFLNISLNLTVVFVYFFALQNLPRQSNAIGYYGGTAEIKSAIFGAAIGLLEDMLSGSIIGAAFFSKGLIGFFSVVAFAGIFFKWTPLLGCIAIIIFTFLDGIIVTGFWMVFSNMDINVIDALKTIFIQSLINIPFGIILMPKNFA